MGPGTNGVTVCVSAEAGLEHHRGAQRLSVLTFAPAESMTPDDLLYREQPGSRRHGMLPRVTGAPVARAILVDGVPVDFAGYEIPGLTVLLAGRPGHAIGASSRDWPLADVRLVRITDFAPYESVPES